MSLYDSSTYLQDLETAIKETVNISALRGCSVLVTGATGTIGSFIVDTLLNFNRTNGANICIYASGRNKDRLEKRYGQAKTENLFLVEHDVHNPVMFDFQVDYIIHAAGNAYPAAFNRKPVDTITDNIMGTYALLEYGRTHGTKRFLYVSTGEIYGQYKDSVEEFVEDDCGYIDPTSPRSCYGNSKRAAETLCVSYMKQYSLETVIVRPCHTYGPYATERDNRANVQFVRNALNGEDIVMKSAGTQMRSYCYIADCVSAVLTVLINGRAGEAYNSANPKARVTIAEFAQAVANAAGKKVIFTVPTAEEIADRTPIPKQVLSSKKLENLGWKGNYPVEKGVRHMMKILREI